MNSRMGVWVLVAVLVTWPCAIGSADEARQARIKPGTIIWSSEAGWERGTALLKAGQTTVPSAWVACRVDEWTTVQFLQTGYAYSTFRVLVLEGPHVGCEGNVTHPLYKVERKSPKTAQPPGGVTCPGTSVWNGSGCVSSSR